MDIPLPPGTICVILDLLFGNNEGLKYAKDWKDLAFSLIDTIVYSQQEESLSVFASHRSWSPQLFAYACTKGYVRLASFLIDWGFKDGSFKDLEKAVAEQSFGIVALLLENKIGIETLQGEEGAQLLLKASRMRNQDIIKLLAHAGANPCSEGSELYYGAAQNGWDNMIEWLYQSGAQIERGNVLGVYLRNAHDKGIEPNQNSIVRLLERGSNVSHVPDFLRKKYSANLCQACCSEESGFRQKIIDPLINRIMRLSDHLSEKIEVTGKGRELKGIILQALMQSDLIYRAAAGDHNAILITEEICRSLRSKLSELLELSFYFNVKANSVNREELVSELKNSLLVIEARYKIEEEKATSEKEFYRKELELKEKEIEEAKRKRETNERLQREEMERKANEHKENLAKQEELAEKQGSYLAYIDQENAKRAEEQAKLARQQLAAAQAAADDIHGATHNILNNYRW